MTADFRFDRGGKVRLVVGKDYYLGDINERRKFRLNQYFVDAGLCPTTEYDNLESFPYDYQALRNLKGIPF